MFSPTILTNFAVISILVCVSFFNRKFAIILLSPYDYISFLIVNNSLISSSTNLAKFLTLNDPKFSPPCFLTLIFFCSFSLSPKIIMKGILETQRL